MKVRDVSAVSALISKYCDLYNYDFREDYTGRFMYGKLCVGIVCDNPCKAMLELGLFLHAYGVSDDTDFNVKLDNMGKSYIVYFPDIQA